jgi:hypothetical protein
MGKLIEAALGQKLGDRFENFIRQFQKDNVKHARRDMASEERFADLEADLGFLAMLNVAMLRVISDNGLLKDGELMDRLEMADRLDGVEDGALSMNAFRDLIGVPRKKARVAEEAEIAPPPPPPRAVSRAGRKPATAAPAKASKAAAAKKTKPAAKAKGKK